MALSLARRVNTPLVKARCATRRSISTWSRIIEALANSRAKGDVPSITVVILLVGLFGLSQGLTYPLLSLILERQGVDPALIGFSSAMTPLGIVAAAAILPAAASRIGSAPLALVSTLALAGMIGMIGLLQSIAIWIPLRFLLGCGISGLYVTSETWINSLAPAAQRGRILGLFSTSLSLGFACGPLVLIATGTSGAAPFWAAVGIELVGAALILGVFGRLPDVGARARVSVRRFVPLAPFLLLVVGVVAAYDQSFLTLFPIYVTAQGFSEHDTVVAVMVWAAGNILFQVPIGVLADRWSRRGTTILLCSITIAGAMLLPAAVSSRATLWPLLFVWGPASYGVYTLALGELGSVFKGGNLVAGNAAFAMMWGLGGLLGPSIIGLTMHATGPGGLPLALGCVYALLLVIAALRRPPAER